MARRQQSGFPKFVAFLALLALAGTFVYFYWFAEKDANGEQAQTRKAGGVAGAGGGDGNDGNGKGRDQRVGPPASGNPTAEESAKASDTYREGLKLLAGDKPDLLAARTKLSKLLAGGKLPTKLHAECRQNLTKIAQRVVFSRRFFPNDPHAKRYVVKSGDRLSTIVKREKVYVPYEGIALINGINPNRLREKQWLKLVQGPFDAVITKSSFTLDLYHKGMFVKSYPIGLGQNGSTPVGTWIAKEGGRVRGAPWTPPDDLDGKTLTPSDPGYPLGTEGLWIALQGTDKNTRMLQGFGIHGTNEPDSIGKEASLGCIRLADKDIAEVFAFLYDGKSAIEVRP